jgi:hypothetical protein
VQDPGPGRIGKESKRGGNLICGQMANDASDKRPDVLGMDTFDLAPLGRQVHT